MDISTSLMSMLIATPRRMRSPKVSLLAFDDLESPGLSNTVNRWSIATRNINPYLLSRPRQATFIGITFPPSVDEWVSKGILRPSSLQPFFLELLHCDTTGTGNDMAEDIVVMLALDSIQVAQLGCSCML